MKKILPIVVFFAGLTFAFAQSVLPPELNRALFVGVKGDDVRSLQTYLAQDKTIYPEGLVTGYFGKLTEAAVKKFQTKYSIDPVGIVGPKTRAKLTALRQTAQAPVPPPTPAPSAPPSPEATQGTAEPAPIPVPAPAPTPVSLIKTGSGTVKNNQLFNFGTGDLYYSGTYGVNSTGNISPSNTAILIGNLADSDISNCEDTKARSYGGVSNICFFTGPNIFLFKTLPAEGVRFYDKKASKGGYSCNNGVMLFQQGGFYGGIDFVEIDQNQTLQYNYWYDQSGGTNFPSLCPYSSQQSTNALASSLDSLREMLEKLKSLTK